jgi:flagellar basal-body rod protein FlgC
MDYQQAFAISAAGMNVERTRAEVATMNLANANTVSGASEPGYLPQRVVARSAVGGTSVTSSARFEHLVSTGLAGPSASIEATGTAPRQALEPGHPMADSRGFVTYPGVDPATEMLTLMSAVRSYEANVAAMNATRSMALKALDIGSGA